MKTILLFFLAAIVAFGACQKYEPPPGVTLEGLSNGVLDDPHAPLVIDFGMAVDPNSASIEIAYFDLDADGNLPDEAGGQLRTLFRHDLIDGDIGGSAALSADATTLTITPAGALPVGPRLVLLVEPGLRSTDGRTRNYRTRVPFSYAVKCSGAGSAHFQSGAYFLVLQVEEPVGATLKMFAILDVDPATGTLSGQVTGGFRNTDGSRCPGGCPATDACQTIPQVGCVAPSTPPGSVEEYPDFVANSVPPIGYTFEIRGCAVDEGSDAGLAVNVLTAPTVMVVEEPAVSIQGLTLTAQFAPGADGLVRATGSLSADATFLGTTSVGAGKGTMSAIRVPDDRAPTNLVPPTIDVDGGAQ